MFAIFSGYVRLVLVLVVESRREPFDVEAIEDMEPRVGPPAARRDSDGWYWGPVAARRFVGGLYLTFGDEVSLGAEDVGRDFCYCQWAVFEDKAGREGGGCGFL